MEIILKKDVDNLGYANDVVKVKTGYAVNYLIPQGFAILATPSARKQNEEIIRQRAHKEAEIIEDAENLAEDLNTATLTIAVKVSEAGTIYGSVGPAQVSEALAKTGRMVDKKKITIETIKTLGTYEAIVRCYKDICATVKVEVVSEAPAEVAEEAPAENAETPVEASVAEPEPEAAPEATETPSEEEPKAE